MATPWKSDSLLTSTSSNTIILYGDSINQQNTVTGAKYNDSWGDFIWANILLGQRFTILDNQALSGQTTAWMLANFSSLVVNNPKGKPAWVYIQSVGLNDAAGSGSTISNLQQMFALAQAAGIRVMTATMNTGLFSFYNSQATLQSRLSVNSWLRDYARNNPNIELFDFTATALSDVSTLVHAAKGDSNSAYFRDPTAQIHPNTLGSKIKGQIIYNQLVNRVAPSSLPLCGEYNGTNGNAIVPFQNGLFIGSTGTVAGAFTGSLGTNWSGSVVGNIAAVASKVTRASIDATDPVPGEWQKVVITSQAGSALTDYAEIQNATLDLTANGSVVTGDTVYAELEFQVLSAGQVGTVGQLQLQLFGVTPAFGTAAGMVCGDIQAHLTGTPEGLQIAGPFKGVLRTPPMTLITVGNAAGNVKYLSVDILLGTSGNVNDTSTILLGRCRIVKVN